MAPVVLLCFVFQMVKGDDLFFSGVLMTTESNENVTYFQRTDTNDTNLDVPGGPNDLQFPIGSNTKLFTAVSLYQLAEKGLLNMTDNIADYLDESDFKKFGSSTKSFCPKLWNKKDSEKCETITFENLLSMSSGIINAINCNYDEDSPFRKYCVNLAEVYMYAGSVEHYVGLFIDSPLSFTPGRNYSYSNPNFILSAYFIRKLSGMPYGEYVEKHILNPLEMNMTYYDPWDSDFVPHKNLVSGYRVFSKGTSGKIGRVTSCREVALGALSGTGGLVSTVADMHKFYHELFNRDKLGEKVFKYENTVHKIVRPMTATPARPGFYFAQGVVVRYDQPGSWPTEILYQGGTNCFHTAIILKPHNKETGEKDMVVTAWANGNEFVVSDEKMFDDMLESFQAEESGGTAFDNALASGDLQANGGNAMARAYGLLDRKD